MCWSMRASSRLAAYIIGMTVAPGGHGDAAEVGVTGRTEPR